MPETNAAAEAAKKKWKLLAKAAASEKRWTNERLAWLFTPQGVLFAALGLTLSDKIDPALVAFREKLQIGIPILGVVVSIVVFFCVLPAAVMHQTWTKKMQKIAEELGDEVTFGHHPHWPASLARWAPVVLPLAFAAVWVWLLMPRLCCC